MQQDSADPPKKHTSIGTAQKGTSPKERKRASLSPEKQSASEKVQPVSTKNTTTESSDALSEDRPLRQTTLKTTQLDPAEPPKGHTSSNTAQKGTSPKERKRASKSPKKQSASKRAQPVATKNTTAESPNALYEDRPLRQSTLETIQLDSPEPPKFSGTAQKGRSPKKSKRPSKSPEKGPALRKASKNEEGEKVRGEGGKDKEREKEVKEENIEQAKRTHSPTTKNEDDSERRVKVKKEEEGKEHLSEDATALSNEVKQEQRDLKLSPKLESPVKGIDPEDLIKIEQADQKIAEEKWLKPNDLEKGHIYFFYRPRVQTKEAHSSDDVARLFLLLKPLATRPTGVPAYKALDGEEVIQGKIRLVVVPKKKLPEVKDHARYWGFVRKASEKISEIDDLLGEEHYETKTRGERFIEPCRPIGAGVYSIIMYHNSTRLAYILNVPSEAGEIQKAFNIGKEGSFVLSVKNPETPSPPQAGLGKQKAKYPKYLQETFHGRRFILTDPVEFLDYEGCELLLIGAHDNAAQMGEPSTELEHLASLEEEKVISVGRESTVFTELRLDGDKFRPEPLFGMWA